ncbi:MAG: hypothetical protein Q7S45_00330 [Candidatus Curtissbacteria bacterium]|nr:hypothetical protein [Candidatus Curtissbacteria bacterium]
MTDREAIPSLPDLVQRARESIDGANKDLAANPQIVGQAVDNLEYIDSLRSDPAVMAYLSNTGVSMWIIGMGFRRRDIGLLISSEGFMIRKLVSRTVDGAGRVGSGKKEVVEQSFDQNRIQEMLNGDYRERCFVRRLAELNRLRAVQKIGDGLNHPIEVVQSDSD